MSGVFIKLPWLATDFPCNNLSNSYCPIPRSWIHLYLESLLGSPPAVLRWEGLDVLTTPGESHGACTLQDGLATLQNIYVRSWSASVGGRQELQEWGTVTCWGPMWAWRWSVLTIPQPEIDLVWTPGNDGLRLGLLAPWKETESHCQGLPIPAHRKATGTAFTFTQKSEIRRNNFP